MELLVSAITTKYSLFTELCSIVVVGLFEEQQNFDDNLPIVLDFKKSLAKVDGNNIDGYVLGNDYSIDEIGIQFRLKINSNCRQKFDVVSTLTKINLLMFQVD